MQAEIVAQEITGMAIYGAKRATDPAERLPARLQVPQKQTPEKWLVVVLTLNCARTGSCSRW